MKKILLILSLALTFFAVQTEAKKVALLVGISNYETANLGWKNLHATNDLDLLTPLFRKAGFEVQQIRNNAATHNAVINKLDKLAAYCKKGDKVFILLSGHGQQKVNTFGDDETYTQTFIPFNAAKKYRLFTGIFMNIATFFPAFAPRLCYRFVCFGTFIVLSLENGLLCDQ